MAAYSVGVWTAEPGQGDAFAAAWHALGEYAVEAGLQTHGTLLRDHGDPQRFVSVEAWRSADRAERGRADAGYAERLAAVEAVAKAVEHRLYEPVLQVS